MLIAFTGHRPQKLGGFNDATNMRSVIRTEIMKVVDTVCPRTDMAFISGMALGVDTWAAELAIQNNILFYAYVPFIGQEKAWPTASQTYYHCLLSKAHKTIIVTDGTYAAWKMQRRNEAMVNDCNVLIAVWDGSFGGTYNCIKYAQMVHKRIIIINPTLLKL